MSIKLSIIVPTHNSEKFIVECVESIMQQAYENIEIICVDSSKDSTPEILQELAKKDSRICIIFDENGSYGHKINVGIRRATGDYIGIVESDDYILPNMYTDMLAQMGTEQVDYIKSNALHFGDINGRRAFCPEKKEFLVGYYDRVLDLENIRDIAITGTPTIWTALYRKAFLLENEVWMNETPGASYQDTSFAILVGLLAKACIFVDKSYYCYRRDNENSSVVSKDKVDYVRQEFEYIVRYLQQKGKYTDEIADLLRRRKLVSYRWNCMRLSDELAEQFIMSVAHEMKGYSVKLVETFGEHERRMYELLAGKCSIQEHRKQEAKVQSEVERVLDVANSGRRIVLVGAGRIGQRVLKLQEYIGEHFVDAVADNGMQVIGTQLDEYSVKSVDETVEEYPDHTYIIANKNHASEIEEQLISLGVTQSKILCVTTFPGEESLFIKCIKYYN